MKARHLILGLGLFLSTAAHAVEIDFSQTLLDLDGKPYWDCAKWDRSTAEPKCEDRIEHTLGLIAFSALDRPAENTNALAQTLEQARRGALARKVYKAEKVDLSSKEIDQIIDLVGKLNLRPAEAFRVVELLDPARLK